MSFVGIALCRHGMVGFGDTKSSVNYGTGGLSEDPRRQWVKKVFHGEGFLLCAYGANDFLEGFGVQRYVEDWLLDRLARKETPAELLSGFCDAVFAMEQNRKRLYRFFVGGKDSRGLFVREATVADGSVILGKKNYAPEDGKIYLALGGASYYTERSLSIRAALEKCPPYMWAGKLREVVQQMVREGDAFEGYNSVGGEIQTETL